MAGPALTKHPAEILPVGVNFSRLLAVEDGQVVVLAGSSCAEANLTDPEAGASLIVSDSLVVSADGTTLIVKLSGGVHEQQHKLTFRAATSSGNLFEEDRIITVRD